MRWFIEVSIRTHAANAALGIDAFERLAAMAFASHPGPWTSSGLSEFISIPRPTVIRRLREHVALGLVEKRDGGWCATEMGTRVTGKMLRETREIITGERQGYSASTIAAYAHFRDIDSSAARSLSWGPLPK